MRLIAEVLQDGSERQQARKPIRNVSGFNRQFPMRREHQNAHRHSHHLNTGVKQV